MQKYRFSQPRIIVEVSKSPLDQPEPGNRYTIFDCLCRPIGISKCGPRKTYQITATTPAAAGRMARDNYAKDYGQENR